MPPELLVSKVRLMATIPTDVANRVIESWQRSLKDEAEHVYAKILSRIPDEKRFVERLGQPSHDGFSPFVNPDFVSKSGADEADIQAGQASNIKRSYEKYREKLLHLFETVDGIPAKRFREMVDRMKQAYASGTTARTLPFTGTKIEGRGLAPLAGLWLVNNLTVLDQLRAGDQVVFGNPYRICKVKNIAAFKAALTGRLVQAGARIIKANYAVNTFTKENDHTNEVVQGLVDPALNIAEFSTGGDSHVDYITVDEQLFLEVQVSVMP